MRAMHCILGFLAAALAAVAADPPQNEHLRIDAEKGVIELDGEVTYRQGLIELFACTPEGKTHESIVSVDVTPSMFHLYLNTVLGLEAGGEGQGPVSLGDAETPVGDPVDIEIAWTEPRLNYTDPEGRAVSVPLFQTVQAAITGRDDVSGGAEVMIGKNPIHLPGLPEGGTPVTEGMLTLAYGDAAPPIDLLLILFPDGAPADLLVVPVSCRTRIEEWIVDEKAGAPLPPFSWIFSGSEFQVDDQGVMEPETYAADAGGGIVVTYHDPEAILDIPMGGDNDMRFRVNEAVVPALGTPVTLIFRSGKRPEAAPG